VHYLGLGFTDFFSLFFRVYNVVFVFVVCVFVIMCLLFILNVKLHCHRKLEPEIKESIELQNLVLDFIFPVFLNVETIAQNFTE